MRAETHADAYLEAQAGSLREFDSVQVLDCGVRNLRAAVLHIAEALHGSTQPVSAPPSNSNTLH